MWLLSRLSPTRRIALLVVACFEAWEVVLLFGRGIEHHNPVWLLLGLGVLFLLLAYEVAEYTVAKRDHELAHEISEWLLPHTAPRVPGLEVAFSNRVANHVGSDYFNVFPRWAALPAPNANRTFIIMADVAGTGLQGALIMATFQASLRVLADSRMPLPELATLMNQWVWDRSLQGRHFTMAFLAELDSATGELNYVLAGHQAPLLCRKAGEIEWLEKGGFPLGAMPDSRYDVGEARLESGDVLLVFTDGVVLAENSRGEEYGLERITQAVRVMREETASEIVTHLRNSMLSFCGTAPQMDDLSLIIVRRLA